LGAAERAKQNLKRTDKRTTTTKLDNMNESQNEAKRCISSPSILERDRH